MIEVGDLERFGFRIGPLGDSTDIREVSIFIAGEDITRHDRTAYLPSFVAGLEFERRKLNQEHALETYVERFAPMKKSQLHLILLQGDRRFFDDEKELEYVSHLLRFMQLGEPNTDPLIAFLLPSNDGKLAITYQYQYGTTEMQQEKSIRCLENVTQNELIQTLGEAISLLT